MAGLLTEVCVIYPALNAKDEGYEIQVVADASGSSTKWVTTLRWSVCSKPASL